MNRFGEDGGEERNENDRKRFECENMNKAFFLQLVFNASLLLTLALIYDLVAVHWRTGTGLVLASADRRHQSVSWA